MPAPSFRHRSSAVLPSSEIQLLTHRFIIHVQPHCQRHWPHRTSESSLGKQPVPSRTSFELKENCGVGKESESSRGNPLPKPPYGHHHAKMQPPSNHSLGDFECRAMLDLNLPPFAEGSAGGIGRGLLLSIFENAWSLASARLWAPTHPPRNPPFGFFLPLWRPPVFLGG
jgi:hypothetical protein